MQHRRQQGEKTLFLEQINIAVAQLVGSFAEFAKQRKKICSFMLRKYSLELLHHRTGSTDGNAVVVQKFRINIFFNPLFIHPHNGKGGLQQLPGAFVNGCFGIERELNFCRVALNLQFRFLHDREKKLAKRQHICYCCVLCYCLHYRRHLLFITSKRYNFQQQHEWLLAVLPLYEA